jgi:predicted lipoprotein with Yx(FWY)xxD motif
MRRGVGVFVLGLVALVACGGDNESPPVAQEPEATGATVQTADAELGTILTDADGNTLYVFLNDTGSESTCYDDCAATWPALETDGDPQAGAGVDESLLGTTDRTDGTVQVTHNGMPLYYFADDESPGDTNGQGIADVWFVVSPKGEPIQK